LGSQAGWGVIATVSTPAKLVNNPCCESIRMVAAEATPHHAIADNITAGEFIGCISYRQARAAQYETGVLFYRRNSSNS
jgi:hypothetical protein